MSYQFKQGKTASQNDETCVDANYVVRTVRANTKLTNQNIFKNPFSK